MRVALVHDYLTQIGGAEKVLEALCAMYPDAPIFTLIYDEAGTRGVFRDKDIRTSFLQRMPLSRSQHRLYPALMPWATEELDVGGYDLVISSSWSFTKGIITGKETMHVSFCHTPLRYAWDDSHRYVSEFRSFPRALKVLARPALTYLRLWDRAAAQRPDAFIANSEHVRRRIQKYYGRDADVVYPPVRTAFFGDIHRQPGDALLMVGRLMAYKRFDLGILAAERVGIPLRIIGDGPEASHLRHLAGPQTTFLGAVDDETLKEELASAKLVLFPQEEDFGIVAVEALAAGVPVMAYRAGGATEIIEEGKSGAFFEEQTVESLEQALKRFSPEMFTPKNLRKRADLFSPDAFERGIQRVVSSVVTG